VVVAAANLRTGGSWAPPPPQLSYVRGTGFIILNLLRILNRIGRATLPVRIRHALANIRPLYLLRSTLELHTRELYFKAIFNFHDKFNGTESHGGTAWREGIAREACPFPARDSRAHTLLERMVTLAKPSTFRRECHVRHAIQRNLSTSSTNFSRLRPDLKLKYG